VVTRDHLHRDERGTHLENGARIVSEWYRNCTTTMSEWRQNGVRMVSEQCHHSAIIVSQWCQKDVRVVSQC
jgi:hypothetical protein